MSTRLNWLGLAIMVTASAVFVTGCWDQHHKEHAQPASSGGHAEIAQKTCPVMGGAINKDLYVDHDGRRIYVCCKMCIDTVKKDPAKYVKKLDEQLKTGTNTDSGSKSHEGHGSH